MSDPVILIEHLSKSYRLGQIGTGTLSYDLKIWWAKLWGKPNPMLRIGEKDHGNREGEVVWALKDVDLQVHQGEVVGIIGKNGAGKSTLLKILARVTAPTMGQVKVKGRIASLLEVGTGFHPDLTGRENIYLNGAILGMRKDEIKRKFDEIVEFAGISQFIDTPVKRYSSGMYVRLAFAVAAHLEPEILLVDEVLAVGDYEFQKKCLGKMSDVAKAGRTVLFVSHNMGAVSSLCNLGVLLFNGQIITKGGINSTIAHYLSLSLTEDKVVVLPHAVIDKPYITRVCIIDGNGSPIKNVKMGEPFGVQVEFKSPYALNNPNLGIRINTPAGNTVLGITSYMQQAEKLATDIKEGVFKAVFKKPNLNQGTYYVTLTFAENQANCDRKAEIIKFDVTPVDIYNTGKIPSAEQSHIFSESEWQIIDPSIADWS